MSDWDTPPTEQEVADAWANPPTPEEVAGVEAPKKTPLWKAIGRMLLNQVGSGVGMGGLSSSIASPSGDAAGRGALQGATYGFSDELAGLGQAYLSHATKQAGDAAPGVLDALGIESRFLNEIPGVEETYRRTRDEEREANERAASESPWAYGLSEFAGGVASPVNKLLMPFKIGSKAPLLKRALTAAGNAIAPGALAGLGQSKADLAKGEYEQAAIDEALGAGTGTLLAPLAEAGVDKLGRGLGRTLEKMGLTSAGKALYGGAHSISTTKKPISEAAERAAVAEGGIKPLQNIHQIEENLGQIRETLGKEKEKVVQALTGQNVMGPSPLKVAMELDQQAKAMKPIGREASRAKSVLISLKNRLLDNYANAYHIDNSGPKPRVVLHELPIEAWDTIKRELQKDAEAAYSKLGRLGGTDTVPAMQKALAANIRERMEQAIDAQIPNGSAALKEINSRLGPIIEAHKVAEKGAAQALKRQHFSLTDVITGAALGAVHGGNPLASILGKEVARQGRTRLPSTLAYVGQKLGPGLQSRIPGNFGGALGAAAARTMSPESRRSLFDLGEGEE